MCRERYWNISKADRIEAGLRPDAFQGGYSGTRAINCCSDLLACAFRGAYPFQSDTLETLVRFGNGKTFQSPEEIIEIVEELVEGLEGRLDAYEHGS